MKPMTDFWGICQALIENDLPRVKELLTEEYDTIWGDVKRHWHDGFYFSHFNNLLAHYIASNLPPTMHYCDTFSRRFGSYLDLLSDITHLQLAAIFSGPQILDYLIQDRGYDVNGHFDFVESDLLNDQDADYDEDGQFEDHYLLHLNTTSPLKYAILAHKNDNYQYFLTKGASGLTSDFNPDLLAMALRSQNWSIVQDMLSRDIWSTSDSRAVEYLYLATQYGTVDLVEQMLSLGWYFPDREPEVKTDSSVESPLELPDGSSLEPDDLILEPTNGSSLELPDDSSLTPSIDIDDIVKDGLMKQAIAHNTPDMIEYLSARGYTIDSQILDELIEERNFNPQLETVIYLQERGYFPSSPQSWKFEDVIRRLSYCASRQILEHLVSSQLLDPPSEDLNTCLELAVMNNPDPTVPGLFLSWGADVHLSNHRGIFLINIAAHNPYYGSQMVDQFLEHGFRFDYCDSRCRGMFYSVTNTNDAQPLLEKILFWQARGWNLTTYNAQGWAPIHILGTKYMEVYWKVLQHLDIDLEYPTAQGNTLLHILCHRDFLDSHGLKFLLQRGADVWTLNSQGLTPRQMVAKIKNPNRKRGIANCVNWCQIYITWAQNRSQAELMIMAWRRWLDGGRLNPQPDKPLTRLPKLILGKISKLLCPSISVVHPPGWIWHNEEWRFPLGKDTYITH